MTRIRIMGLCLVAVFALSAVAAASSSAAVWKGKKTGGSSFEELTAKTESTSKAVLVLSSNGTEVECEEGTDKGWVGPKAEDEVTEAGCTKAKVNKAGIANCTAPVTVTAVDVPWKTTLLSATEDELKEGGKGAPGWEVKCANGAKNKCTRATVKLKVTNNANGTVGLAFNPSEEATCTIGKGKVAGTDTVSAGPLSGYEALKVE